MLTSMEKSLLRERIRYRRTHWCFFPKYVVTNRCSMYKFTRADIPLYLWCKIKNLVSKLTK